jgi:hypothetical protein
MAGERIEGEIGARCMGQNETGEIDHGSHAGWAPRRRAGRQLTIYES